MIAMTITLDLPKHVTSLATAGVLVSIDINVWTGSKSDKKIADRVSADAGATGNVGKWSHDLLAGDPDLKAVLNHRQTVYNFAGRLTYDWMGNLRYLPGVNAERFMSGYDALYVSWLGLVDKLLASYDDKVAAQAFVRGELFRREDYPTVEDLRSRFNMRITQMEVPVGDFRVQIANDLANDMRLNLQRQMEEKVGQIYAKQVEQLKDVMQSLSHCCALDETLDEQTGEVTVRRRKIYDTTIQRAIELCDTFDGFNPRGDALLSEVRDDLYKALRAVDVTALRASDSLRTKVKSDVDSILSKFQF